MFVKKKELNDSVYFLKVFFKTCIIFRQVSKKEVKKILSPKPRVRARTEKVRENQSESESEKRGEKDSSESPLKSNKDMDDDPSVSVVGSPLKTNTVLSFIFGYFRKTYKRN